MVFGLYRIPAKDGQAAEIRIDNNGIEHSITEEEYRNRRYKPSVTELPTKERYLARQWLIIGRGTAKQ
jgi:hypothetical protein